MTDFTAADYFSDESVAVDAYPYFDFLLDGRRVWREPHHGVVMVAGTRRWSPCCGTRRPSPTSTSWPARTSGSRPSSPAVIERPLDRTSDVRVSHAAHGPAGARRYGYLPTSMIRGLSKLNLEFD
jgi:hypothetical protein